jgi:hypothetical protein
MDLASYGFSENRMASKCFKRGSEYITALLPQERNDKVVESGNTINDAEEILLVCGKCGYLGPAAPTAEATAGLRIELDDSR